MTEQTKRQLIKALAYDTDKDTIKATMGVTDEEINSVTAEEVAREKNYYKEMGWTK